MYAVALLIGIVPVGPSSAEVADVVEINHCYNRQSGERRFIQVIYWTRHEGNSLHVREWHMLDKCQMIYRVRERGKRPVTVIRNTDGKLQVIRASKVKVTHTFYDPEEENRKLVPVEARKPFAAR